MLRIIAGIYKNKKINQPDKELTRASTEKVREAVFASLHFKIVDSKCLDLFAGSGAWSIEAESRGASSIVAIEKNKHAFGVIQNNFNLLKTQKIRALNTDALDYLNKTKEDFDFIFIDAPFKNVELVNNALELINHKQILTTDGEIIIETDLAREIIIPSNLKIYKQKQHGRIELLYVCWN
ncbi:MULTISPECIES: 16S rRNA (guanine(966)-N(2))-methyltransferase RsmD [unclassified Mycoplasma]|uniref:16S rRNA (guanine(966)-N(2))-methyltransferase RsmD n=1 Tax=unclassified Mycoplasma TaxID=2683645 RepID=UPI00211C5466|nr:MULTISPECIES: 16S rRNA (guanine(966)-N(2))-methyltransferase RsmD [unclassified Mycoplasma]UUM19771.1 16S rRNA (guanine(966)-N(2))-methyltransferase RsmD [Mycoplasma sp. 1578d]UUM24754.1 16S rRNA (guanine(966)-N(2))-methyltransferase RsmD [Mycoplasma sp. 3686d]